MVKAIRIPWLVDMLLVEKAQEITEFASDPRLDRGYAPSGPLLNRLLANRIRRTLRWKGDPLPPVAPRGQPGRAAGQDALAARLAGTEPPFAPELVDALGDCVLGLRPTDAVGLLCQEVLGRLFADGYEATRQSWDDARTLDAALRSFNPVRHLLWRLGGGVERAKERLAAKVGGDPAGLHTTGIAVHNLVLSLGRLRGLAAAGSLGRISTAQAVSLSLAAPTAVVRQATAAGIMVDGSFRPGTLVLLRIEHARTTTSSPNIAFMTGSWSACPAHDWVPALLSAIWESAVRKHRQGEGAA